MARGTHASYSASSRSYFSLCPICEFPGLFGELDEIPTRLARRTAREAASGVKIVLSSKHCSQKKKQKKGRKKGKEGAKKGEKGGKRLGRGREERGKRVYARNRQTSPEVFRRLLRKLSHCGI